jgi:hypothetical protein
MSWGGLLGLGVTLRPYDDPPPSGGVYTPFDAPFGQTLSTLTVELRALKARTIALQLGYREDDLRLDGWPRANAMQRQREARLAGDTSSPDNLVLPSGRSASEAA